MVRARINAASAPPLLIAVCAWFAGACAGSTTPNTAAVNMARHALVSAEGTEGDAAVATDGQLAPEGAAPADAAITFEGARSSIVVDLGTVHEVKALLLQVSGWAWPPWPGRRT